jgi:hypothetical protein
MAQRALLGWLMVVCMAGIGQAAEGPVTRQKDFAAGGITAVSLDAGVGSVRIEQGDADRIRVTARLEAKRMSNPLSALPDVSKLDIRHAVVNGTLELRVDAKNLNEDWVVTLARTPLNRIDVELGVGDIEVQSNARRVSVEAGVGDVRVDAASAEINVDVDVGDARVVTSQKSAGSIEAKTRVGEVTLKGSKTSSVSGSVGASVSSQAEGSNPVIIKVGVGDVRVDLTP